MTEIKVVDIKLKIVRGRTGPTEKRFEYSTLIEYIIDKGKDGKNLIMGIVPPTYFHLKKVLNEDLDDLERVIFHNIRKDDRKYLEELFVTNNLLKINLKKALGEIIDRVVIDNITETGRLGYIFSASIYLNNGQRIPNVIPSDGVVLAILGKKDIYVKDTLLEEKEKLDQQIEERMAAKKDEKPKIEYKPKETDIPKNIYT